MKRFARLFLIAVFSFFSPAVFFAADDQVLQILVPRQVFVGDTAQIQYVFHSGADLFPAEKGNTHRDSISLTTDDPVFTGLEDQCLVKSVELERSGYEYTLVLTLVPWKAGIIDFPPFDLNELIHRTFHNDTGGIAVPVDLSPVTIDSLVTAMQITTMRPPVPPLVIPGTTWVLYGAILLLICLAAVLILLIRRIPRFADSVNRFRSLLGYRRNARGAVKRLRKLLSSKTDDRAFCLQLQFILRRYLERRFDNLFTTVCTPALRERFLQILGGEADAAQEDSIGTLVEIFHRTDYVRYAHDSADSQREPFSRYGAALADGERGTLVASSVQIIASFDERRSL